MSGPDAPFRLRGGLGRIRPLHFLIIGHWSLVILSGAVWGQNLPLAPRGDQIGPYRIVRVFDAAAGREIEAVEGQILVRFDPGLSSAQRDQINRSLQGTLVRRLHLMPVDVVQVPAGADLNQQIAAYRSAAGVRYAERRGVLRLRQAPPFPGTNPDTLLAQQVTLANTKAFAGWQAYQDALATPGQVGIPQVTIAIIDSGMMLDHPDLAGNLHNNPAEAAGTAGVDDDGNGFVDDIRGWDFFNNDNDPQPRNPTSVIVAHGTAVAGIAGARGNNGQGIAGYTWNCKIMPLKVGDDNGGLGTFDVIADAILYAARQGATVANLSLGGPGRSQVIEDAILEAVNNHNMVIVAAAGNSSEEFSGPGQDIPTHSEPTGDNIVIGVGATDATDAKTDFSNFGFGVDLMAPGARDQSRGIFTTMPSGTGWDPALFPNLYSDSFATGTSFSSPAVTGLVALVRSLAPNMLERDVVRLLMDTADASIYQISANRPFVGKLGAGLMDVAAAARAIGAPVPEVEVVEPEAGHRTQNLTPIIRIRAQKSFSAAPPIAQVGLRVLLGDGSGTVIADQTPWLDLNGDGLDDRAGNPFPAGGEFSTQVNLEAVAVAQALFLIEATATHSTAVPPPAGRVRTLTSSFRLTVVRRSAGLHMLGMPYALGGLLPSEGGPSPADPVIAVLRDPQTVLSAPVGGVGQIQMARWDPRTQRYIATTQEQDEGNPILGALDPGKCYWVRLPSDLPRLFLRGVEVPSVLFELRDEPGTVTNFPALAVGWHQFANPFNFPVALGGFLVESGGELVPLQRAVQLGLIRGSIFHFDGRDYVSQSLPDAVVEPFEGYWFRTREPVRLFAQPLEVPSQIQSVTRSRTVADGWVAELSLAGAGTVQRLSFGAATRATQGYDEGLDEESPPAFAQALVAGFAGSDSSGPVDLLRRDIRASVRGREVWTLLVRSDVPDAPVSLTWSDLRSVPPDIALYLEDPSTGRTVSLRSAAGYAVQGGAQGIRRELRLIAERRGDGAGVFVVSVLGAEWLRSGQAEIAFRLSAPGAVDVTVLNSAGRAVRHLVVDQTYAEGTARVLWDGRSDSGSLLPAGEYIVEIVARSDREEVARASARVARR